MTTVILSSENPDFSYLIQKNPNSAPAQKTLRKGVVTGFFKGTQTYGLHFRDHPTEVSFSHKNNDFEYLDRSRYLSSLAVAMSINTLLRSGMNLTTEQEDPFTASVATTIELNHPRYMGRLAKELDIFLSTIMGPVVMVVVRGDRIGEVLRKLALFCIVDTLFASPEDDPIYVENALLEKYARIAKQLDISYYARYMFLQQVRSPKEFDIIRGILQKEGENFLHGNTRSQRTDAIMERLTGGSVVYDIGCGEMYQTKRLSKVYSLVHAIDRDEDIQAKNQNILQHRHIENVTLLNAIPEIIEDGADVLATEMLEHNSLEDARNICKFLESQPFRQAVLTVPNREFNPLYGIPEGEFRHDDHCWEPTKEEFVSFVKSSFPSRKVSVIGVGDSVNNVHTSLLAHITA